MDDLHLQGTWSNICQITSSPELFMDFLSNSSQMLGQHLEKGQKCIVPLSF
jgi:hypothetical protein